MESNIQIFQYNESPVTFQKGDRVMVNATQMAKQFGKRPIDFLQNSQTQEFLDVLAKVKKSTLADLVQVKKGGARPGTWMHEDVAMEFARWLSPAFAIWCNDRIKELATTGVTTTATDDEAILHAMQVLQQRVADNKQRIQMLESENECVTAENKQLKPLADFTKEVLQSTSTYTLTQIAHDLGLRSVYVLTSILEKQGVIYYQSKMWQPTVKVAEKGYFTTRTAKYIKSDNTIGTNISLVVTEKGRMKLHEFFNSLKARNTTFTHSIDPVQKSAMS